MQKNNPKFSILIANYNYGKLIGDTVESVLKQTVADFEIVIVDDGSTDNSPSVIRRLKRTDKRVRAFRQPNCGQAAAFNRAFKESRGEILCFLDADDLWAPTKLEWMEKVFAARPDAGLIQHNLYIMREATPTTEIYRKDLISGDILSQIASLKNFNYFVPTSGIAARRSTLTKVFPIPEQFRICADAYVTRASVAHGPLFSLDLPLGFYRIHGNNCWTGNPNRENPTMVRDEVMPILLDYFRKCGVQGVAAGKAPLAGIKGFTGREAAMITHIVLTRIIQMKEKYSRIAIYGAGSHTRWLFNILQTTEVYPEHMPKVTAIMDDQAERCESVADITVSLPKDVPPESFDAVILSSDCYQQNMRIRLREVFNDTELAMADLYEGLPQGPYPKLSEDEFIQLQYKVKSEAEERESTIIEKLIVERLRYIGKRYPRIALYGAGMHTMWLMALTAKDGINSGFPTVTAIMDYFPERCAPIAGLQILSPIHAKESDFDAILISSDQNRDAMCYQIQLLLQARSSRTPIIDLYEGLPQGPYAKANIAHIFS